MRPLSYGLVAIGGAVGSVARAWVGASMLALTGPGFPWGTLLINVVGSFVIALFGSLTLGGSRFEASAEWRAFVMIGLCGGFTTFSSFSLQTLDLIRDGRPLHALANVMLSVLLCVAACAAGYGAAQAIRG